MTGRFMTPARCRTLTWLTAPALLATGAAVLAIRYPNTGDVESAPLSSRPASVYVQPASVPLAGARKQAAVKVARAFLVDAVLRVDPAAAWNLVTPSLRTGTSRTNWRSGNIPVVPYEQGALLTAKWRLSYSYADRVGFAVELVPKPGAAAQRAEFTLELNEATRGPRGHWLVSSWSPAPTLDPPVPGATSPGPASISPLPVHRARLDSRWLLIPLGVLVLALVLPIGIGTREWRRGVRAARAQRSRSALP